jgi:acid stress-induced BolA-like protein IbaG/YrbA
MEYMDIADQIEKKIRTHLRVEELKISTLGDHVSLRIVSSDFQGKTRLERQRMVYAALGDLIMGRDAPIHAVDTMETLTPSE